MKHDPKLALQRADELEMRLNALPEITDVLKSRGAYRAALVDLKNDISTLPFSPAKISDKAYETTISMLGFRASGTSGLERACRNWIAQVRAKKGEKA